MLITNNAAENYFKCLDVMFISKKRQWARVTADTVRQLYEQYNNDNDRLTAFDPGQPG